MVRLLSKNYVQRTGQCLQLFSYPVPAVAGCCRYVVVQTKGTCERSGGRKHQIDPNFQSMVSIQCLEQFRVFAGLAVPLEQFNNLWMLVM